VIAVEGSLRIVVRPESVSWQGRLARRRSAEVLGTGRERRRPDGGGRDRVVVTVWDVSTAPVYDARGFAPHPPVP
jgi:hypothetical protein